MRSIDLFCGAGGSSVGLKNAGFDEIIGVDIHSQPEYPFKFIQCDIFGLNPYIFNKYDFIWASPPCQAYSWSAKRWDNDYPDLINETRELLLKTKKSFVIENVCNAPVRKDLILTGQMFGLKIIRRRAFELNGFWCMSPMPGKKAGTVKNGGYVTVAGHGGDGKASLKSWQDAMKINWITDRKKLAQAVPPVYAEWIGRWFLKNWN